MSSASDPSTAPAYPSAILRERIADAVVHGLSLIAAAIACTVLLIAAALKLTPGLLVASVIYCSALLASFVASASPESNAWVFTRAP